jgi:hypothetical protein
LGRPTGDFGIDRVTVEHLRGDQFAGQCGGVVVALRLGQVALQHRIGRALAEVRFEYGRKSQATSGPPTADPVSPRRHRPGR